MRGNVTKRGKSSWRIKFDVAGASGKRETRFITVRCETKKEAEIELTKLLAAADQGTLPDPSNATVAEYLDAWLGGAPKGSAKTMERRAISESDQASSRRPQAAKAQA